MWVFGPPALWFVGSDACANWEVFWVSCLPVLLCFTCLTAIQLRLFQPRVPSDGPAQPHEVLQQFAWTAGSVRRKRASRRAALSGTVAEVLPHAMATLLQSRCGSNRAACLIICSLLQDDGSTQRTAI